MSSEFNDMERMFQEGLQNYEVIPPAHVWSNIQKRKRRGLIFYKWKIASILLLLCIAGTSAYYFANSDENNGAGIITQQTTNNTGSEIVQSETNSNIVADENSAQEENVNNSSSNSVSEANNQVSKIRNSSRNQTSTGIKDDKESKEVKSEEISNFDTKDLLVEITSKDKISFRYVIYPSLMQFIYTTKKLGKKYITPEREEDKEKLGFKYSIEIIGGPAYAYRKLSGEGDILRNESEKAAMCTQTGLKINYHFNPTWSLQSGIMLENRHENISYDRTEIQDKLTVSTHQVTVVHPVLPPRTIFVTDSVYTKENVNYKFSSTNKYTTFNIPIVVGYTFGLGKMQYRISAGSLFNIYSINTASNLVRNGDKIEMAPYKESSKIKTSVYGGISLQYPLNQNCLAITEFSCYKNMSNRMNNESPLNQKNYGFSLNFGARFNILK